MPEIDGFELARRVRQDANLKAVLLIAMTGYGEERHQRASREAGFDHHLVKPVDPRTLLEFLAERIAPLRAAHTYESTMSGQTQKIVDAVIELACGLARSRFARSSDRLSAIAPCFSPMRPYNKLVKLSKRRLLSASGGTV